MRKELYFLRSSEQKIVLDSFKNSYADLASDADEVEKYTAFYGLTRKDLGVYALVDGSVAGALWARKFSDDGFATVMLDVREGYAFDDIAAFMMEQFLQEAATQYEELRVDTVHYLKLEKLCQTFGFAKSQESQKLALKLEKKEIIRPSDGYDARKWME